MMINTKTNIMEAIDHKVMQITEIVNYTGNFSADQEYDYLNRVDVMMEKFRNGYERQGANFKDIDHGLLKASLGAICRQVIRDMNASNKY